MQTIINKFLKAENAYNKASQELKDYFRNLIKEDLVNAKTKEDFINIKEKLRPMPESVGKVLLFREIILREDNLLNNL